MNDRNNLQTSLFYCKTRNIMHSLMRHQFSNYNYLNEQTKFLIIFCNLIQCSNPIFTLLVVQTRCIESNYSTSKTFLTYLLNLTIFCILQHFNSNEPLNIKNITLHAWGIYYLKLDILLNKIILIFITRKCNMTINIEAY